MKVLLALLAVALVVPGHSRAADDVDPFYASLRRVFVPYYREVAFTKRDDTATFEQNCRIFLIHEPLKTGEWQDASEERGPKKGGIYCTISSQKGPYEGQAAVPQTFDKHYFKVLLLVSYSKRLDRHLHVLLSYPHDVSPDFLREFTKEIERFGEY